MTIKAKRVNVTLDAEHAERLEQIAARAHVSAGTLARSILCSAIEDADPDASSVTAVLDSIPGAYEGLAIAERQVHEGRVIPLEDL